MWIEFHSEDAGIMNEYLKLYVDDEDSRTENIRVCGPSTQIIGNTSYSTV